MSCTAVCVDDQAAGLRDLLGELAERVEVRVLLWAGAPVRVFTPARAAVRRVREELIRGTRVRVALDSHERPMHCHHEKLVIVDGPTRRPPGPRSWTPAPRKPSNEFPTRDKAPAVTTNRRLSSRKSSSLNRLVR
jgi:hypothetical protein